MHYCPMQKYERTDKSQVIDAALIGVVEEAGSNLGNGISEMHGFERFTAVQWGRSYVLIWEMHGKPVLQPNRAGTADQCISVQHKIT